MVTTRQILTAFARADRGEPLTLALGDGLYDQAALERTSGIFHDACTATLRPTNDGVMLELRVQDPGVSRDIIGRFLNTLLAQTIAGQL